MHKSERPDRPLVVKCTFERSTKRITFSSARNCSYDLLRSRVEQCFSLFTTPYAIAYKDDDGEVADITTESDLTEAIHYFQAGSDDPPLSSAASILSGRSFGKSKITLRVHIAIDYDGPSLSDTSSLASLDEYRNRNGSQISLTLGPHHQTELDDDSVTVSSRDAGSLTANRPGAHSSSADDTDHHTPYLLNGRSDPGSKRLQDQPYTDQGSSFFSRYCEDLQASLDRPNPVRALDLAPAVRQPPSVNDRATTWLQDQADRSVSPISVSPTVCSVLGSNNHRSGMGGDLALRRDPRGKYYYSYTSASSSLQSPDSEYDDGSNVEESDLIPKRHSGLPQVRPTSMHLDWLASQQIPTRDGGNPNPGTQSVLDPPFDARLVDSCIPPDVLQFLPVPPPPRSQLTDCSECGVVLEAIRYVCTTCGESTPRSSVSQAKGKVRDDGTLVSNCSPYERLALSSHAGSSRTLVSSLSPSTREPDRQKPLPSLPYRPPSPSAVVVTQDLIESNDRIGYELCSGCIESAGVTHAIEVGLAPASPTGIGILPSSEQDVQLAHSQWIRSAPKQKGQSRHCYLEKSWGHRGWEDVEQDDCHTCKCSTCHTDIISKRYKCASCSKFNLCRACYSQVHLIHPTHAFLVVPEKPPSPRTEPDQFLSTASNPRDEQSMMHHGVKCTHCRRDVVGARFHCAICESVEICSSCESAGLPGNIDSSEGEHSSSHIMIKIPYPVDLPEVQAASRRAVLLWTGRDSVHALRGVPRSRPSSIVSYARTVVGFGSARDDSQLDHHLPCNNCGQPIIGVRYQCASCSSSPMVYSLCVLCESRSYTVHDPNHIFVKLPRPVEHPLQSLSPLLPNLYRVPAGYQANGLEPREYLKSLVHSSAVCDRCMTPIQGEWFRCAYCSKDLCDSCEELDTHDKTHVFFVFKSPVDMQLFRSFVDLENPSPVIPYPIYH